MNHPSKQRSSFQSRRNIYANVGKQFQVVNKDGEHIPYDANSLHTSIFNHLVTSEGEMLYTLKRVNEKIQKFILNMTQELANDFPEGGPIETNRIEDKIKSNLHLLKNSLKVKVTPTQTEELSKEQEITDSKKLVNLNQLKGKTVLELIEEAKALNVDNFTRLHKNEIIVKILKAYLQKGTIISSDDGVLEILPDGFGFLRSSESSYRPGTDDIYVSPSQIRRFELTKGDTISGIIRPPNKESERYFALLQVTKINKLDPTIAKNKVLFENLTPLYASERLILERGDGSPEDITGRIIDLVAPLGKGQRGLIVSSPKAGKTMVLQNIAKSITKNHPECYLMVLLVGERPEEVTDMKRSVQGEVIASTFDEPVSRHIQVAEMAIEKAKRLVEKKVDVVILMDSITRLARAYNTAMPSSGKVLTGGVDANAFQPLKKFFGAARNIEEGGSLTILATALIDTDSMMEKVTYHEFKGTGNVEIHLDLDIAQKRIFPAINVERSGSRREEYLTKQKELQKMWIVRRILHSMDKVAGMEFLIERLKKTKTNAEFFDSMQK